MIPYRQFAQSLHKAALCEVLMYLAKRQKTDTEGRSIENRGFQTTRQQKITHFTRVGQASFSGSVLGANRGLYKNARAVPATSAA